jgi:hypothetical protein
MVMRATAVRISKFACIADDATSSGGVKPTSNALGNWELVAQVFPNVVGCEEAFSARNVHNGSVNFALFFGCPFGVCACLR